MSETGKSNSGTGAEAASAEHRAHYDRGWKAGQNASPAKIEAADRRREHPSWYIGFFDAEAGNDRYGGLSDWFALAQERETAPSTSPSDSWLRAYDRAAMRGDDDRMVELLRVPASERPSFECSEHRRRAPAAKPGNYAGSQVAAIDAAYDRGESLRGIIHIAGDDEASLFAIHSRVGVAMSTLRREADAMREERESIARSHARVSAADARRAARRALGPTKTPYARAMWSGAYLDGFADARAGLDMFPPIPPAWAKCYVRGYSDGLLANTNKENVS